MVLVVFTQALELRAIKSGTRVYGLGDTGELRYLGLCFAVRLALQTLV